MRPLLLKFAGIGSYPGKVEIDFSDLSAMGLYLIVGRTGAGKTTIFDAMTYALYGKVSADRENSIVSGHPGRENPFIEFTFEHAGITYIAHREPALPGKAMATNKQWVSIVGADGNETQRISQTRQVNEKVKEVIGLNDAEFMQVILLPQGKFQQFLLAKSNDKKGMLQAIFGTSAYRRIVERMMVSAKQLQLELDKDSGEISNQWAVIRNSHETLLGHEIFEELPDYTEETQALIDVVRKQAIITEAEAKAARTVFAALANNATPADTKTQLTLLKTPESVRHLVTLLSAYDWEFVEQAKQMRGMAVAKIIEETNHPDARIRLKAIEMLGRVTEVALFTDRLEVKKTDLTDAEIDQKLQDKLDKLLNVIDVDITVGETTADITDVEPSQPDQSEHSLTSEEPPAPTDDES